MHWDGTITLGNILTLVFGAFPILGIVVKTYWLMKEYPPHKHVGAVIIYPRDMEPK